MFWSGNFMVMRELNFLLKEENVTLASVLEADDILQECKADNKALMQFLTRPDILAELITLITEEPPKNVELSQQYRHASIACEVLTSHLSTLSDRLTLDTTQMNRLCDFINKDPPLNPLLASYFSKTVEMLLERSPKQDWYLYHIVCLRVLDFFKSRRDFLPNLLRHISTSAIADTFKYLIRLEDLFNKPVMEWLEEHQFLDSLIQIICGTYEPEHFGPEEPEKGQREPSEKHDNAAPDLTNEAQESQGTSAASASRSSPESEQLSAAERQVRAERIAAVAASNAAALLCDLVATGCAAEGCSTRSRTAWQLAGALGGGACVRGVLCHVFTCAPHSRARALHHAARLLQTLLLHHTSENEEERCGVELAVAPHLPLLHQALLHDPAHYEQEEGGVNNAGDSGAGARRVGCARVSTAALIAQLALSEVEEVATTLLTLGTPYVLLELMFSFPENNFLHAQVVALCRNALSNRLYRTQYARHLFVECDMLTRLMDAFEDNEHKLNNSPRAGYMGHVIQLLGCASAVLEELAEQLRLGPALLERWRALRDQRLAPVLLLHDTPLGGTYPSDNLYEAGEELDNISDTLAAYYDFNDMAATTNMDDLGDDLATDHEMRSAEERADCEDKRADAHEYFLSKACSNANNMWDEPESEPGPAPAGAAARGAPGAGAGVAEVWSVPAWESGGGGELAGGEGGELAGGEGWAQFDAFAPPAAFAEPPAAPEPFAPFWPAEADAQETDCGSTGLETHLRGLRLAGGRSLADNLLTAMSAMSPAAIANIVNANLQPLNTPVNLPPEATAEVTTPNPVTPPAEFSNAATVFPSETSSLPLPPPAGATPPASLDGTPDTCRANTSNPRVDMPLEPSVDKPSESTIDKPSDSSVDTPSDTTVDKPSEETVDTPSAPSIDKHSKPKVEVNCVTPADGSPELKSQNEDSNMDGKVNDLSPEDKVSVEDRAAIETRAAEVVEPADAPDTSER